MRLLGKVIPSPFLISMNKKSRERSIPQKAKQTVAAVSHSRDGAWPPGA